MFILLTKIFYEKISEKIETPSFLRKENEYSDRYYIQKITPFFVNQNIYYEITFILANDYASKFDRIIAFSKHNILDNYAVKLIFSDIIFSAKVCPICVTPFLYILA